MRPPRAIDALVAQGFRPRVPVDAREFADASVRRRWIEEKGMQVFTLIDPANPMRTVDLFVDEPIPFEQLWRADVVELASVTMRVAAIADLIQMKRRAGRAQDLIDIEGAPANRGARGSRCRMSRPGRPR